MESFSQSLLAELEIQLGIIEAQHADPLQYSEEAIKTIVPIIDQLRNFCINYIFRNESDEIYFFKTIKPKFLSHLIYYNEIYAMESNKPVGGERVMRKYLLYHLSKLKIFYRDNGEFCKYYRTGNDCFDFIYFKRRSPIIRLSIDSSYFLFDQAFSTMNDFKAAKVLANDRIERYIINSLESIQNKTTIAVGSVRKTKWTGSKTSLIELIYALHTYGVLNDGRLSLKEMVSFFEAIFSTDLGQYHRVFLDIRNRKSERTKFLNTLREKLVQRMEDADESC